MVSETAIPRVADTEESEGVRPSWGARLRLGYLAAQAKAEALLLGLLQRALFAPLTPAALEREVRRVLVYRIGNIGDILINLPTLHAIRRRFPAAHICFLTSPGREGAPGAREMLPPGRLFDEMWVYHDTDIATWAGRRALLGRIRDAGFDLFVELPDQLTTLKREVRHLVFARLAGCRFAVGFQVSHHARFAREQMLFRPGFREKDRIYAAVAGALDLGEPGPMRMEIPAEARRSADELLRRHGIVPDQPFVVIHVGAKRPTNRWFPERFAAVATRIRGRYGLPLVFTGAGGDRPLVDGIVGEVGEGAVALCGLTSLPELAALLERATLYVGNDTGAMHLAVAVGTPTVSLFSARDFPDRWFPAGKEHLVLRRDVPCSPCLGETCSRGLACLDRITVDDVMDAVHRQLGRSGLAPILADSLVRPEGGAARKPEKDVRVCAESQGS